MAWIFVVRPPRERPKACEVFPSFQPAAERCARTMELSVRVWFSEPSASAKGSRPVWSAVQGPGMAPRRHWLAQFG